ncbi:MAG: hypothetical protein J6Y03_00645 [Alphaproteobacteria bacterium]|nr:hypothetical protein [Alphaproteobacteria bacterium]
MDDKYPFDKSAEQMGIPVDETLTAVDEEPAAVMVEERLPSFSLHSKWGQSVRIPGIPMHELYEAKSKNIYLTKKIEYAQLKGEPLPKDANVRKDKDGNLVKRDFIREVFEKYIDQTTIVPEDFNFALDALKVFYMEYSYLDHEDFKMSNMVRAAIKEGLTFDFYEKSAKNRKEWGTLSVNLDDACAQYSSEHSGKKKAIQFNCDSYPRSAFNHNTLAHELCHYAVDNDSKVNVNVFEMSDFGKMWYQQLKNEAFLGREEWDETRDLLEKKAMKENRKEYGTEDFFIFLSREYKSILNYDTEADKIDEMFARVTGLLSMDNSMKKEFSDNHVSCGVQLACRMAEAKANEDDVLYNSIVETLKEHKMSSKTKDALFESMNLREEIKDRGDFSQEDWNNFAEVSQKSRMCMFEEYKDIIGKIKEKREAQNSDIMEETKKSSKASELYNTLNKNASHSSFDDRGSVLDKKIKKTRDEQLVQALLNMINTSKEGVSKPLEYPPVPTKNSNIGALKMLNDLKQK